MLEILDRRGFLIEGAVDPRAVDSARFGDLIATAEDIAAFSTAHRANSVPDRLGTLASISLSGGAEPCSNIECRIKQVRRTVEYTAIAGTRTYVQDPFYAFVPQKGHLAFSDSAQLREDFFHAALVLNEFRPAIEAGLVELFAPTDHYCHACWARLAYGSEIAQQIDRVWRDLRARYRREVSVSIEKLGAQYGTRFEGPHDLLEHGSRGFISAAPPPPIDKMPRLRARVDAGETLVLNKRNASRLPLFDQVARSPMMSVTEHMIGTHYLKAGLLTDRQLDIDLLQSLGTPRAEIQRNAVLQEHLSAILPFLSDLPVSELLRLREECAPEYAAFRVALNKSIDDVLAGGTGFGARDAQQLRQDVLEPRVRALDESLTRSRARYRTGLAVQSVAWGSLVAFGVLFGVIPNFASAAISAIAASAAVLGQAAQRDPEDTIRRDPLYFIWRAKRLSS